MSKDNPYVEIFIEEARENLQDLNKQLLIIEENGYDEKAMKEAFRLTHTLKGTANVVGVLPVGELSHVMEDLFDIIQAHKQSLSQEVIDQLFDNTRFLENMVEELADSGQVQTDASGAITHMRSLLEAPETMFSNSHDEPEEVAVPAPPALPIPEPTAEPPVGSVAGPGSEPTAAELLDRLETDRDGLSAPVEGADGMTGVKTAEAAGSAGFAEPTGPAGIIAVDGMDASVRDDDEGAPEDADEELEDNEVSPVSTELNLNNGQKEQILKFQKLGTQVHEFVVVFQNELRLKVGRAYQVFLALSNIGQVIASAPELDDITDEANEMRVLFATSELTDENISDIRKITGIERVKFSTFRLADEEKLKSLAATNENIEGGSLAKSDTVRVKSEFLDRLLDQVGEMMVNNIRMDQISGDLHNRNLIQVLKNNGRLTSELQDVVLRMRMVPVDYIFNRFPRMVRDLARESEKVVNFKVLSGDIEIDRTLLDDVGDALVHILRNAVDHGIESSDCRKELGKPRRGSLILSASTEQNSVVITVEDDGKGMDPERIKAKAIKNGLITQDEANSMEHRQIIQLIFQAGLSTAENVTNVSGRGVGMDIVRSKVESLGGDISVDTNLGEGTRITIRLPPSMAIIRAMLVEANNEKYAIPLENVSETAKIPRSEIHDIAENRVFRLRKEILPVVDLHTEFGGHIIHDDQPAIIVEKNETRACLMVTKLIGQQEIVVKNLDRGLRQTGCFSGATIMGDGRVAMILDVGAFV